MELTRRSFLWRFGATGLALLATFRGGKAAAIRLAPTGDGSLKVAPVSVDARGPVRSAARKGKGVVISTWRQGVAANEAAGKVLSQGGNALDAVEQGVRDAESDPDVMSVGYGGRPNEDGVVELDASIMWGRTGNAGAVGGLREIKNPISVARLVMERSDHVMLVGEGAQRFALAHGFKREDLLTEKSRKAWLEWKETLSEDDDWIPQEDHDTIGMVALDENGDLAGACTTSGLAYKIPGRVGDSPIIGAGMYVDNAAGAAAATGRGEAVMKMCGSFLVVELMRRGKTPQQACEDALNRIIHRSGDRPQFQVAFIALNKDGETGAASLREDFDFALWRDGKNKLHAGKFLLSK